MSLLLPPNCLCTVATWSHERVTIAALPVTCLISSQQSLRGAEPSFPYLAEETALVAQELVSDSALPQPTATHHQGIGEAQAHQASRELPVQGVGDGGGSGYEHHTCSDVLLRKDRSWSGLLWVRATGTSSCLNLGAESSSSASLGPSPTPDTDTQEAGRS